MEHLRRQGRQTAGRGYSVTYRGNAVRQATRGLRVWGAMFFMGICLSISGCASKEERRTAANPGQEGRMTVAVFPVENLTGKASPLDEIRTLLTDRLRSHGFGILDDATLDDVVTRHRVRYTAGVEREIGKALKDEAGAVAILIPSLEQYDETYPPKIAIFCRMVSTGDNPAVLWMDGTGLSGDDSPGLLGLGLIEDPRALTTRAVESLARSLAQHGSGSAEGLDGRNGAKKFQPKIVYRSEEVDTEKKQTIAVVPFFNKSPRKYAGEIIALHMMRNLMAFRNVEIVEPGIVRQELLKFRIIMNEGVSLPDTDTILNAVDADLVLNGEVLEYQDYQGPDANPKVDFSVLFIERKTRKVVYSSYSQNAGDDGVYFFDWGKVNTAHAMASQMARAIGQRMLMEAERSRASKVSNRQ